MARILLMSAALAISGAVSVAEAQLPPPVPAVDPAIPDPQQPSPDPVEQRKQQARSFAAVLRSAVEIGGQRLQQRVHEIVPTAPALGMAGEPDIVGAPHPDGGFVFHVQVPDILPSYFPLLSLWQQRQQPNPRRPVATAPPAAEVDRMAGAVGPDAAAFDPDREYATFVREGLIEAMIENSHALGIGEDGHLVVVASVTAAVRRNPLDTSRLLILSLAGADLAAYRQNRLTKEEIRARIRDQRF